MKLPSDDVHLEIEQEELLNDSRANPRYDASNSRSPPMEKICIYSLAVVIGLTLVFLMVPSNTAQTNDSPMEYTCPSSITKKSLNDVGDNMEWYISDDKKHKNDSIQELKQGEMDGWGIKYVEVKRMLRPWKERIYVPNIKSGDTIYESACGSGLNLLLTTEILKEHKVTNLTVYGNDYVAPSVEIANRVWNSTKKANTGNICVGDSTNLSYVPSNSFDFVYTGYIDPLVDPLSLSTNSHSNSRLKVSIQNCFSNSTEKQALAKKEQQAQEDWYNMWITEMIRIAKPGAPVVSESNSESVCKHFQEFPDIHDWGGVDKEWWSSAISTYKWNVDPESLVIQDSVTSKEWVYPRYHVFMRKSKA